MTLIPAKRRGETKVHLIGWDSRVTLCGQLTSGVWVYETSARVTCNACRRARDREERR